MTTVLVAGRIHREGIEILQRIPAVELIQLEDPDAPIPDGAVARAEAILIRYGVLSEAAIARATSLRVVSRHGVGYDNLPLAALTVRGIPVTIVGPVTAVTVAEQTFALMLAVAKRIPVCDRAVRSGHWSLRNEIDALELNGKRLLLIGFGRIGREVAYRARAFGMQILVYDPHVDPAAVIASGAHRMTTLHEALPDADVISLHVPLTRETRNLLGEAAIERMKPSVIVLNTARGGLIDEAALAEALATRLRRGGAGLDVFADEPPDGRRSLLGLPNVVVSPHSAALTVEAVQRMGVIAARNVVAGLEGTLDPSLVVNPEVLAGDIARSPAR